MVVGDVNHRAKCLSILFHFNHFPDVLGLEHQMQAGITAYMCEIYALLLRCFLTYKNIYFRLEE